MSDRQDERCWWCDAIAVLEGYAISIETGDRVAVYRFPEQADNHEHSLTPPSPQELTEAGYRTYTRGWS